MKKSKAQLNAKKLNKSRNPIANSAIMRKGGVHEKTRKAKRQTLKRELRATLVNQRSLKSDLFYCLC